MRTGITLDSTRVARRGPNGELIPPPSRIEGLWNAAAIGEGVALVTMALQLGKPGQYQLQAAIAAVHDEAPSMEATDWPQIVSLYEVLLQVANNPVVELNHAVAVGMAQGPRAGLQLIDKLQADARLAEDYRRHTVRAPVGDGRRDRVDVHEQDERHEADGGLFHG